jgi:tRNA (uracil-5-)-methyltransferase
MPYRYACYQLQNDRGTSTGERVSHLILLHNITSFHLVPLIHLLEPDIRLSASALINSTIWSFKRGATLLLRDSLPPPTPTPTQSTPFDPSSPTIPESDHLTITNHREQVYERVGPYIFQFAAGSFFQNNNSILIPLTEYVKQAISTTLPKPSHLVDTYCGSGLFGITLSDQFERVAGVEISSDSIKAAKVNAEMNGLGEKTEWLCGKAEDIFGGLAEKGFEGGKSCVVVDVSHSSTIPPHRPSQVT